jgi:hypothetical protein
MEVSKKVSTWLGIAVSGIAVLGFFGIKNSDQLWQKVDPGSKPATSSTGQEAWDSNSTDQTPLFTEDALLSRRFTDTKGIEFARVAAGARPCGQAATASNVVKELTGHGCTEVMTGAYLEQPGPNSTPDNPVLVSVQVLPFPDAATANSMENYLNGGAIWNLTTWCPLTGVGTKPCIPPAGRPGVGWSTR